MTGRNPNVFYETGYAHALNKPVILLTQQSSDIPFDLKHYPHIIYERKITLLKTQLERKIRWYIENPQKSLSEVDLDLNFSINGSPIANAPVVEITNAEYCYFTIEIHNPSGRMIDPNLFSIALVIPKKVQFHEPKILSAAKMPGGEYIYSLEPPYKIFPFGWSSLNVAFKITAREKLEIVLRFFTELGFKDYRFFGKPERIK